MTHYTNADLATADRHIAEAEQHIARQEEIITELRSRGQPTEVAEQLLVQFNDGLHGHWAHRQAIAEALSARG